MIIGILAVYVLLVIGYYFIRKIDLERDIQECRSYNYENVISTERNYFAKCSCCGNRYKTISKIKVILLDDVLYKDKNIEFNLCHTCYIMGKLAYLKQDQTILMIGDFFHPDEVVVSSDYIINVYSDKPYIGPLNFMVYNTYAVDKVVLYMLFGLCRKN